MERKTTRGLLALLFAFVVACTVSCATPAGRTTGTVVDDATITARVKTALLADKDVSGVAVSVVSTGVPPQRSSGRSALSMNSMSRSGVSAIRSGV